MKIKKNKFILAAGLALGGIVILSCSKEFLERNPVGQISDQDLNNPTGVNGMLIGAYALLDGSGLDDWLIESQRTSVWNAWAGSVASDDAHKGADNGAQTERAQLENKTYTPTNSIVQDRWKYYFAGVQRANDVLRGLDNLPEGAFTSDQALQIRAEARFLRGVYHYQAAIMYNNIPYIDETITAAANNFKVKNSDDPANPEAWAKIAEDFKFAADNLTPTKSEIGRAHSWAAKAFLAKTYMQQAKLDEAKPILDDIITNGTNSAGTKLGLQSDYSQLFKPAFENGPESVFSVQMSVNDGGTGRNGNDGEQFNNPPWLDKVGGWGHQPSFNLVNAFKTENGLPMLDNFNEVDVKHNFGTDPNVPFDPYTGPLDPRLDWTVGRKGLPYHDYGIMVQNPHPQGGPFWGKKWVVFKGDGTNQEVVEGWKLSSGINYPMIRFADVLLLAAECEVEIGDLSKALQYVNLVRARAAKPESFLKKYNNDANPADGFSNTPAANYVVAEYAGFASKDVARKAVRFERRIELATEGHRFFDLQRFDRIDKKYGTTATYMADLLNKYMDEEVAKYKANLNGQTYEILEGATFVAGKHEVFAIPQRDIDQSKTGNEFTLKQNPGHN